MLSILTPFDTLFAQPHSQGLSSDCPGNEAMYNTWLQGRLTDQLSKHVRKQLFCSVGYSLFPVHMHNYVVQ